MPKTLLPEVPQMPVSPLVVPLLIGAQRFTRRIPGTDTVATAAALCAPLVTVIVAWPAATAVTTPVRLTVATAGLRLVQVTVGLGTTLPLTSRTSTVSACVEPTPESAMPAGVTASYYTTNDPFDKVVAFYKNIGKEYRMPHMPGGKLPNGQDLKVTFIIFDGAADIMASKSWAKIQHPFVGQIDFKGAGGPEYKDIRDLTERVGGAK